jgi:hypothetical protein
MYQNFRTIDVTFLWSFFDFLKFYQPKWSAGRIFDPKRVKKSFLEVKSNKFDLFVLDFGENVGFF